MEKYSCLARARVARSFLDSNATTHSFIFGAMAEIVDNSRDADAQNLYIYTEPRDDLRGGFMLCFRDDGCGMSPSEVYDVIEFGNSKKKINDKDQVGRYGNGLKSGSMRIGKDMILLTKKDGIYTALFVSKTFLEHESTNEVIVPMPSFDAKTKEGLYDTYPDCNSKSGTIRHKVELETILKFSPFKTRDELMAYFDQITSDSGTIVIIFNLMITNQITGGSDLDIETDPNDIRVQGFQFNMSDRKSQMEHGSFRAYVSILYANPKMKIYIQGKRVHSKILMYTLYQPKTYVYTSNKFKNRAQVELTEMKKQLENIKYKLNEAVSQLNDHQSKGNRASPDYFQKLTRHRREKESLEKEKDQYEKALVKKKREEQAPKQLEFTFGLNLENRDANGFFIYNSNRLILMYERSRLQQRNSPEYRGIVGVVNVPYYVSEPTHNKQQFKEDKEQRDLINMMGECMEQYRRELNKDLDSQDFWKDFGYYSKIADFPSKEPMFLKVRLQRCKPLMQCVKCGKWRQLKFHPNLVKEEHICDDWECRMNTDTSKKNCNEKEELDEIPKEEHRKVVETNFNEIQETKEEKKRMFSQNSYQSNERQYFAQITEKNSKTQAEKSVTLPPLSSSQCTEFEPEMSSLISKSISNKRQLPSSQSSLNESSIRHPTGSSSRAPNNTAKKARRSDPLASDDEENDPDYVFHSHTNTTGVSSSQITIKKKTDAQKKSTSGGTPSTSRPPVSMDSTMVNNRSISHSDNFDASTPNISVTPLQFARSNEKTNNNQTFPHLDLNSNGLLVKDEPASTEACMVRALGAKAFLQPEQDKDEIIEQFSNKLKETYIAMSLLFNNVDLKEQVETSSAEEILELPLSRIMNDFRKTLDSEKLESEKRGAQNAIQTIKTSIASKIKAYPSNILNDQVKDLVCQIIRSTKS